MATQINPPYIGTVYKDYSVLSLTGFALDLAVADTLNIIVTTNLPAGQVAQTKVKYYTIGKNGLPDFPFASSNLWTNAGPIMEQYKISVFYKSVIFGAAITVGKMNISVTGNTYLEAGMHALVASTYGTTISL